MNKPKPLNFSFLILTLLFILSQTAFALSATLSAEDNVMEAHLNASKITEPILLNAAQEKAIMFTNQEFIVAMSKVDTDQPRPNTNSTEQSIAQAEPITTPAPTPTPTPKPEIKGVVRYVNANELNVREEPNAESNKVATIKRGDKVTYYETIGEWARIITWTDKKGYILAKHLVNKEKEVVKVEEPKKTTTVSRGTTEKTEASKPATEAQLSLAEKIVSYAKSLQGIKYVYGGYSTKGFDCSGFTKYVFAKYNISVPRSSAEYWSFGTKVDRKDLRAGDIVLFDTDGGTADVSHVGIYVGGGNFIHASTSKGKVIVMNLATYKGKYMGARRVIK